MSVWMAYCKMVMNKNPTRKNVQKKENVQKKKKFCSSVALQFMSWKRQPLIERL